MSDAWEAQLERCYGSVLRGLVAACGSRESAEDALQDALAAALKPGVRGTLERVDGWLYVVGLRALRKGLWRRRLERSLSSVRGAVPGPAVDRVAAFELLGHLTERQREFVIARYWLDLSFREIADSFGVSVSTATSTITRSLERLRRSLEKEASGEHGRPARA